MTLDVRHRDARNVVGLVDERLLILVRNAKLTAAALENVAAALETSAVKDGLAVGCLVVVMPEAGMSDTVLLARQRGLMRSMLAAGTISLALVTLGDTVQTSMIRTFIRAGAVGRPNVKVCAALGEATAWLAPRVGSSSETLDRAVASLMLDL